MASVKRSYHRAESLTMKAAPAARDLNGIVDQNAVMSAKTLPRVKMLDGAKDRM